tara:strand:+ start:112 stop:672 length:561 start_codon:yes stop_codon:yes gene_type:complete
MKIVSIDPKENTITGRRFYTLWYDNASGYETAFLEKLRNNLDSSGFPDIAYENVTIKTGGCMSGYKNEQFEAVEVYSKHKDLSSFRCCFTAARFGNIMHISCYFITNSSGGCLKFINKIISLLSGAGKLSLKEDEYKQAWNDFISLLFKHTIETLPTQPTHTKEGDGNDGPNGGGLLGKLKKLAGK